MTDIRPQDYYGLSDTYWDSLGERGQALYELVRPMPDRAYEVDVPLHRLQAWSDDHHRDLAAAGGGVELNPDFQRGHVWTESQRVAYCEAFLRRAAPATLLFNCPSFATGGVRAGDLSPNVLQCVDGLQRYTALCDFAAGKLAVFGGLQAADFDNTPFDIRRFRAHMVVYGFSNRADVLRLYLDLNAGGSVHSQEELDRGRQLLKEAPSPKAPVRTQRAKP